MYRSNLGAKHRSGAIAAVVAIHAALLLAFLHISGKISFGETQSVLRVFDVSAFKPPPPPPPPPQRKTQPKPKAKEGGSAPKNIKSEATPVVAPAPKIPAPPTIAATETPRRGRHRRKAHPPCAAPAPARAVRGRERAAAQVERVRAAVATAASWNPRGWSLRYCSAVTFRASCSANGRARRRFSSAFESTRAAISASARWIAEPAFWRSTR